MSRVDWQVLLSLGIVPETLCLRPSPLLNAHVHVHTAREGSPGVFRLGLSEVSAELLGSVAPRPRPGPTEPGFLWSREWPLSGETQCEKSKSPPSRDALCSAILSTWTLVCGPSTEDTGHMQCQLWMAGTPARPLGLFCSCGGGGTACGEAGRRLVVSCSPGLTPVMYFAQSSWPFLYFTCTALGRLPETRAPCASASLDSETAACSPALPR